jgi:hypothetical protein
MSAKQSGGDFHGARNNMATHNGNAEALIAKAGISTVAVLGGIIGTSWRWLVTLQH